MSTADIKDDATRGHGRHQKVVTTPVSQMSADRSLRVLDALLCEVLAMVLLNIDSAIQGFAAFAAHLRIACQEKPLEDTRLEPQQVVRVLPLQVGMLGRL